MIKKKKKERKGAAFTVFMPLAYCFRGSLDYTFGQELIPPSKMKKNAKLKKYFWKHFKTFYCSSLWIPRPWLATQAHASAMCDKELERDHMNNIQTKIPRSSGVDENTFNTASELWHRLLTWAELEVNTTAVMPESLSWTLLSLPALFFSVPPLKSYRY